MSLMGESGGFEWDNGFINRFVAGTGRGTDVTPAGEVDDSANPTLEKLNKRLISGGSETATGGLNIPEGRSTTDTISKNNSSWEDNAAFKAATQAANNAVGTYDGIGGDSNQSGWTANSRDAMKPTIFQTSMMTTLHDQLNVQKQMAALLHEIVKNTANGFGGSSVAMDPKSKTPLSVSGDFINDPNLITMHNMRI